ncbi:MAG: prephenate dehydrogenase/arogenate dehydrogenase family protein [Chlorobia bacterium]|nr:prephenate dehydrogenase/arogenate dehydrogenase family protein [Fimbriimonadaceae bacterium]
MTIGIVGCGLVGGSVGLACRSNGHRVLGFEPNSKNARLAFERGCIDQQTSVAEVSQADITFICVPPGFVADVAEEVLEAKPAESVATDCTSTKGAIVSWLETKKDRMFVPGHPMAGHEKSGPQFASAWMFRGAKWIITPCSFTKLAAIQQVEKLVKEMGAIPVRLRAERHDRDVALLSHLPHALAAVLVRLASDLDSTEASAGSWKDLTRVGGVDPKLWSQILTSNREEVSKILGQFGDSLADLRGLLDEDDSEGVLKFFEEAKRAKEKQN